MTSRERVLTTLAHKQPDRIPLDLGGTCLTGMHVSIVYKLRQALGLDPPKTPVKVIEPFQMIGEVAQDLSDTLGCDVVSYCADGSWTLFGYPLGGWKEWDFNGTPVLVPGDFNITPEPNGDILQYPQGDKSVPASARLPKGGFYCDMICRQGPIDESKLSIEDNLENHQIVPESAFETAGRIAEGFYNSTDKAVFAGGVNAHFGEVAEIPGMAVKHPKGIRDINEWYMSLQCRKSFVVELFEAMCERALVNLERYHKAVGEHIDIFGVLGTDFGSQSGPLFSEEMYCELFQPYQKRINDWIHEHTTWKTFLHSCGSVRPLVKHFVYEGFDILNPVQCTAANMDPRGLKEEFGDQITFWGGGVDTQTVLPFGTPDDVRNQVRERIEILGPGGGYVFNPIHNVQANTPIENLLAMIDTYHEYSTYR